MQRTWVLLTCLVLAACSAEPNHFHDSGSGGDAGHGDGANGGMDALGGDDVGNGSTDVGTLGDDSGTLDDANGASADADVINAYDVGGGGGDACTGTTCSPHATGCGAHEVCNNGLDDNCDGHVDEGCPCLPGTVQDCFRGPPGLRNVGACHDGTQRCEGSSEFGNWSECANGISPAAETCDNLDNDCNGCVDDGPDCCRPDLMCPGPGDPRVPDGHPFSDYTLHGAAFFPGSARAWRWQVAGGPCDTVLPHPTFTVSGQTSEMLTFHPTLSGDYTVTLTVTRADGTMVTCTFIVHIAGPGMRVELCWDTSTTVDLDLYVHQPDTMGNWFSSNSDVNSAVNNNSCNWSNCEAVIRGFNGRENWGYAHSPLSECSGAPHGSDWSSLGYCGNPRLDIDNNLSKASGLPENINVDTPRDGQRFRIMVQNFTGTSAHPIVNVYCGGHLRATLGAPPDALPDFTGSSGGSSLGAMWRPADVVAHVNAAGDTTGCDVTPLHAPGTTSGYYVTRNNAVY